MSAVFRPAADAKAPANPFGFAGAFVSVPLQPILHWEVLLAWRKFLNFFDREGFGLIGIAVVEDNIYARIAVENRVRTCMEERGVAYSLRAFADGESFVSCGASFDLVFMDIEMKEMDGLTAAKKIYGHTPECAVVFVTSHPDFVFDSFDVNVAGYLLKPIDDARFARCMDKALTALGQTAGGEEDAHLLVKSGGIAQKIRHADIVLCESVGHKLRIETTHGSVECYGTMDAVEAGLARGRETFFRCHRAFVVNLRHVTRKGRDAVGTTGGHTVPLARRKQGTFAAALLSWLRENALQ